MTVAGGGALKELRLVVSILVPVLLQLGLNSTVKSSTLAFVGHYDPEAIASAALGNMYASITGYSVGVGITMAVGTYSAQNFGRGAAKENGVVVRNCLYAHMLCFVFALFMAGASPALLRACKQPEELLEPVRQFALVSAFAWPGNWVFMCLSTVLSSQNWQIVGVIGQALASAISFALSFWFLASGTGFLGIAFANVVGAWASVAYVVGHITWRGEQSVVWRVPPAVSEAGRLTAGEYLRAAFPIAVSMWVEWWALESMALFAGWLPGRQTSIAAHSLLFNMLIALYTAFVAVSRACMIRVGHQVGAQDEPGIRLAIRVCLMVSTSLACVASSLVAIFGAQITSFYTHDTLILKAANSAVLGVALSVPPYSVTMCLMGALRSAGLQVWGAKAMFVSYYAVGLPLGYCLGVCGPAGLLGIWLGNVAALCCGAVSCFVKIASFKWDEVLERSASKGESPVMSRASSNLSDSGSSPLLWRPPQKPSLLATVQHPSLVTNCSLLSSDEGVHSDASRDSECASP